MNIENIHIVPLNKNCLILFNKKTRFDSRNLLMCQISCMHFSSVQHDHVRLITHMKAAWRDNYIIIEKVNKGALFISNI